MAPGLGWLVGVPVLWPVLIALLCLLLRPYVARAAVVLVGGGVLIAFSLLVYLQGPFTFTPPAVAGMEWHVLLTVLDFALLLWFFHAALVQRSLLAIVFTLAQLVPLAYWEFALHPQVTVEPAFVVDYLSIVMVLVIGIIGSLIWFYALSYMPRHEEHLHLAQSRQPRFFFYLVLLLAGMNGIVMSNNLLWLYFFWEVTTLCCYQLILHDLTAEARQNATRALWMNLLGGTAFVAAMIYLSSAGRSLAVADLVAKGGALPLVLPLALLCLAGLTKAAQVPFQGWLLGAMVAPTPVSALLHSSTMVKAGVYLILRLAPAYQGTVLSNVLALTGGFAFLVTAILALSQNHSKRVLAYSTVSNLGLIILCAGLNTPLAMAAAVLLLIFHAISKGLLFLCAGAAEQELGTREIEAMAGLAARMPFTATIAFIGMLSMLVPPFGMLAGKWAAMEAVAAAGSGWSLAAIGLLVAGSAVTVVFWAKWMGRLLSQGLPREKVAERVPFFFALPLAVLVVFILALSALVGPVSAGLVLPGVSAAYAPVLGVTAAALILPDGFFPVWVLGLIALVGVILPLAAVRVRPAEARPVYACGEHVAEGERFLSLADSEARLEMGGFYWAEFLSEGKLNFWVNLLGVALILALLGVSLA